MASGDRIELLTADTFESAMSTVAKETSVANTKAVVDTINTNVNTSKTTLGTINTNVDTVKSSVGTASTAPSVTSAGGVVNTANTVQQKLQGISQYQIGAANSTGGSATAGNVMAKLNAIIGNTFSKLEAIAPSKLVMSNWETFTGTQTVINITGSGVLYSIIAHQTSNMIIKVDGNIMYNCSYSGSATSTNMGIVSMSFISYDNDTARCLYPSSSIPAINYSFKNGVFVPRVANNVSHTCILPLPIKFSSSLVVTITKNTASSGVGEYGYCYILD